MIGINQLDLDRNLIMVMIDIENLHLISFNFIEELYAMNLDAVNPELESKINDLVCEAYNKSFLEQEELLKEIGRASCRERVFRAV